MKISVSWLALVAFFTISSCEMRDAKKNSPGAPNPNYPSGPTQTGDNSTAVERQALPADGAAATGIGNTLSNTSAASGAVDLNPNNHQPAGRDGDEHRPESLNSEYYGDQKASASESAPNANPPGASSDKYHSEAADPVLPKSDRDGSQKAPQ